MTWLPDGTSWALENLVDVKEEEEGVDVGARVDQLEAKIDTLQSTLQQVLAKLNNAPVTENVVVHL